MSLLSRIRRALSGTPEGSPHTSGDEPASRHDRREAGRERHHQTGEPAWEADDRIEEPSGAGKRNPDAAPEILGGN
ncbi:MAG: hypothetical protein ABJC39_10440 [Chloroflexota bacterium]